MAWASPVGHATAITMIATTITTHNTAERSCFLVVLTENTNTPHTSHLPNLVYVYVIPKNGMRPNIQFDSCQFSQNRLHPLCQYPQLSSPAKPAALYAQEIYKTGCPRSRFHPVQTVLYPKSAHVKFSPAFFQRERLGIPAGRETASRGWRRCHPPSAVSATHGCRFLQPQGKMGSRGKAPAVSYGSPSDFCQGLELLTSPTQSSLSHSVSGSHSPFQ